MDIGSIVKLKKITDKDTSGLLGILGVCYRWFKRGNTTVFSVIFETGGYTDFDGETADEFLDEVGFCAEVCNYEYTTEVRLASDFRDGIFTPIFKGV